MKAAWASIGTAVAASVCCIGPVVGASAIMAIAVRFEPFRPAFLALTIALLGFAFYGAYRPVPSACATEATCPPVANRRAKLLVWITAMIVLLFVAFPYYVEYLF